MARVTLDEVRDYQETSRSLEEALDEMLTGLLGQYDLTNEDIWGEVIDVCLDVFGRFGNAAASLGSMFYQNCRDTQTDGTGSFVAEPYMDERLYGRLTNQIRRTLKTLKTDEKATVETVTNSIKYDVANLVELCNRDTIRENLRNENADRSRLSSSKEEAFKAMANAIASTPSTTPTGTRRARRTQPVTRSKVQFMRVPSANCSCTFCLIMAGRGAVYLNKKTAGDDTNKYHLNCRCSVVPVDSTDPVISQYDYTTYEDMYYDAYDKLQALYDRQRSNTLTEDDKQLLKRIDDAHDAAKAKAKAAGKAKSDFDLINEVEIVMRFYDTNLH